MARIIFVFLLTLCFFLTAAAEESTPFVLNGKIVGDYEAAYLYCIQGNYPSLDDFLARYSKDKRYNTSILLVALDSLSHSLAEFAFGQAVLEATCTKETFPSCMYNYEKMLTESPGDEKLREIILKIAQGDQQKEDIWDFNAETWYRLSRLQEIDPIFVQKTLCSYWAYTIKKLINSQVVRDLKAYLKNSKQLVAP